MIKIFKPPVAADSRQKVVDDFHRLYYDAASPAGGTWKETFWKGVIVWKCPLDLWVYQEIIWETKPDVIVECGTQFGGSALFLADMLNLFGSPKSRVITIDITAQPNRPVHPRIHYITASSVDPKTRAAVDALISPGEKVMVILDSDHVQPHVFVEMTLWGSRVTPGCYMVVEDGNINGHPVYPSHGKGPAEAIAQYLPNHPEFQVDRKREKLLLTFNPGGYLKRIS